MKRDDAQFPSGPWKGFYLHPALDDDRHPMELRLHFTDGTVSGGGSDDVGAFAIRGRYYAETCEAYWTKTYFGRHDVFYHGFGELGFIWGTWELPGGTTGGFKIWPRGAGSEAAARTEAAEDVPEAVGDLRYIPPPPPGASG